MKLKQHKNGVFYAHITGSNPVNLRTKSKAEAAKLAKAANLEQLEFAAKANLLTAEVVQRLSAGGKVTGKKAAATYEDWCQTVGLSPRTVCQYMGDIGRFLRSTGLDDRPINQATEKHVDNFVNVSDGTAASTRRLRLAAMHSFFVVCQARGFTIADPSALVRVKLHGLSHEQLEPRTKTVYSDSELARMEDIDDPFWNFAALVAREYGFRLGDVACLEWASFTGDKLIVHTDKTDKRLELPLLPEVAEALSTIEKTDDRYLFPEQAALAVHPTRRSQLSTGFSRALRRVGIGGKGFHSLRHTFATRRKELGDSVDQIREKLAHSSADTTVLYIH